MASLFKIPVRERESRNGLYHGSRFRRFFGGIAPVAAPAVLRAGHGKFSLGGGGGSQINVNLFNVAAFMGSLQLGDLIVFFINSSWGNSGPPTLTPVQIADNVGNNYINAKSLMIDTGFYSAPAGPAAFLSKYQSDCVFAIHKGGALNFCNFVSAVDHTAWDVTSPINKVSCWNSFGRIPILAEGNNLFNSQHPGCGGFFSATNRITILNSLDPEAGSVAYNGAVGTPGGPNAVIDIDTNYYEVYRQSAAREFVIPTLDAVAPVPISQNIAIVF